MIDAFRVSHRELKPYWVALAGMHALDKSGSKAAIVLRLYDAGIIDEEGDEVPEGLPLLTTLADQLDEDEDEIVVQPPLPSKKPDPPPTPTEIQFSVGQFIRTHPKPAGAMFVRYVEMSGNTICTMRSWEAKYAEFLKMPV